MNCDPFTCGQCQCILNGIKALFATGNNLVPDVKGIFLTHFVPILKVTFRKRNDQFGIRIKGMKPPDGMHQDRFVVQKQKLLGH
ncbi:hypothetical protein D3C86_1370000 [compost metagenome]